MNFETMSKQRKMILIAAAVGIISMFLPWFSISSLFGNVSVSGMNGLGILVFLCFLAAGALAFMGDQTTNLNQTNWMGVLIAGGVAALIALIRLLSPPFGLSASFGLFIALAASIGIVAFAFMNRSASDTLQGGFDSLKSSFNSGATTAHTGTTTTTTTTTPTTTVSHTPTDEPNRPTV